METFNTWLESSKVEIVTVSYSSFAAKSYYVEHVSHLAQIMKGGKTHVLRSDLEILNQSVFVVTHRDVAHVTSSTFQIKRRPQLGP